MATSLRTSKSAMSLSDSLTPKTTPGIKQRVASYHTTEVIVHQKPKSGYHQGCSGAGTRGNAVSHRYFCVGTAFPLPAFVF